MKNIFMVRINTDTTEGRGAQMPRFAFTQENDAKAVEQTLHPYRLDDCLVDVIPFPLYTSVEDYQTNSDGKVKERALAKLSELEKKVLGLR